MGDDVPLPVLASTPHMLYDYFKQRFAQASGRATRRMGAQALDATAPPSRLAGP